MATRQCRNPQPHAEHHTGREEWGQAGHGGFMDDIWCPGVMSREEWVQAVGRQLARATPDMYPGGYAYWLAEQYADEGGYDRFIAGEFSDDNLWEPAP